MLVAAITRTSTDCSFRPPRRRNLRSCSTRSSFTCVAGVISPISSRNSVPRSASSKQPCRRSAAPVNAPFSWPKISLSSSVSGIAAQLMATNGNGGARAELMDRLRDQLLARARLAGDEHRRARRRRLLDHLVDLPHLGAVADHRPERAVLAQLPPQRLDLAQRLLPFDDLVEQNLQPLDVDRLGQVVVGAFLHRLDRGLDRALRRQQQRGDVGALRLQRAQQRQPVHARHHQIGDDDRRAEAS